MVVSVALLTDRFGYFSNSCSMDSGLEDFVVSNCQNDIPLHFPWPISGRLPKPR